MALILKELVGGGEQGTDDWGLCRSMLAVPIVALVVVARNRSA